MPSSITLHFTSREIPDVLALGRHSFACGDHRLKAHVHGEERLEIVFVRKGRMQNRVGADDYALREGQVLIVRPGEPHGSGVRLPDEKALVYWLILRVPPEGKPFLNLTGAAARGLRRALLHPPARCFAAATPLHRPLDAAIALHPLRRRDPAVLFRQLSYVLQFCAEVCEAAARFAEQRQCGWMERVNAYIDAHLDQPLGVPELAAAMRLSVSGLKARFRRHVRASPADYALRRKIDAARARLRRGDPVTRVAFELGFSSSQYFATVFRRYVGLSPRAFARRR